MKFLTLGASALVLSIAAIAANPYSPERAHLRSLTVAELKAIYLQCDRLASTGLLDINVAAHCSMVSEELLERGFGDNFNRLLDWWRSTRNDCRPPADCANRDD